ncbi:unnamed protein product [Tilletia laevis]|uniref:NAD(P)-binding protein n=2 Tax=Tilletia TaxID=13289 RepID=A0A177VBK6_9BASI|nr:hypothetical protein CF336_g1143 [Tilletia laevis]KAE8264620.1 hypothetical protein A4X03_0g809 [Tilletia caries]CAD6922105.1 unnamed protein product [Tilletia controversa]KAE8207504.1 hypothetical protein CF335_g1098 [Tilletia laevis]CAD6893682.1 unnamed protein product [Tilletia caries]
MSTFEKTKPRNPRAAAVTLPNALLLAHAEAGGLKGVVVLITGGASGLGKNTALRFAQYGAKVAIVDRTQPGLDAVAKEARAVGGDVFPIKADVTNWEDQLAAFQAAEKHYGSISVVVANAGITDVEMFYDDASEDVAVPKRPNLATIDVNIKGVVYTIRLALHFLRKGDLSRPRTIVTLGSISSFMPVGKQVYYSISKAAVLGLHRAIALDALTNGDAFQGGGLRTLLIAPFFVRTPLITELVAAGKLDHVKTFATPDDVSAAILHAAASPKHEVFKERAEARVRHGAAYCIIDSQGSLVLPMESLSNSLLRAHPEFGEKLAATMLQQQPASKI